MPATGGRPRRRVIAFDLDDTLIPCLEGFPTETLGFWARRLGAERLRLGTPTLIRTLIFQGWDVWVYTTSFRSPDITGSSLDRVNLTRFVRSIRQRSGSTFW
jgi:phosphoserine phosphatase